MKKAKLFNVLFGCQLFFFLMLISTPDVFAEKWVQMHTSDKDDTLIWIDNDSITDVSNDIVEFWAYVDDIDFGIITAYVVADCKNWQYKNTREKNSDGTISYYDDAKWYSPTANTTEDYMLEYACM